MSSNILIVENDPNTRTCLAELLRFNNYKVKEVSDLIEARQYLEPKPDLAVPTIFLSADHRSLSKLREKGYGCIDKPFDIDELIGHVAQSIAHNPAASTIPSAASSPYS